VDDFVLLPGAPQAIRLLNESGFKTIVITNQSGVARGYFSEETLSDSHRKMTFDLGEQGARVDAIYYCPHHPDDNCQCRKPKPGLLLKAAAHLGITPALSYMIGDNLSDVEAGRSAGCRTIWLTTSSGEQQFVPQHQPPNHTTQSLFEAVAWLVRDAQSTPIQEMRTT